MLLEQLEGVEAPAAAWEGEILPARMEDYDPVWLDALCLSGSVVWGRGGRTAELGRGSQTDPHDADLDRSLARDLDELECEEPDDPETERGDLTTTGRNVLDHLERRWRLRSSTRSFSARGCCAPRSRRAWPSWWPAAWPPPTASPDCARC